MTDVSNGPGWWLASDGKWYPPHLHPNATKPESATPGSWQASDGKWYPPELHPSYTAERVETGVAGASRHVEPTIQSPPESYVPATVVREAEEPKPQRRWSATAFISIVIAFLFWPAGIFAGHWMLRKLRRTGQKGRGVAITGLVLSYAFGVLTVILVALALSKPHGYNDATTLQRSVVQETNSRLHSAPLATEAGSLTVNSAICVHQSGTQWNCEVSLSDGRQVGLPVSVTASGTRWVTDGSGGITALLPQRSATTTSTPTADDRNTQSNLKNALRAAVAMYIQTSAFAGTNEMIPKLSKDLPNFSFTAGSSPSPTVISIDVASSTLLYLAAWTPETNSCWLAKYTMSTTSGIRYFLAVGTSSRTATLCSAKFAGRISASTWQRSWPTG